VSHIAHSAILAVLAALVALYPAVVQARPTQHPKLVPAAHPTVTGTGGAAATVDPYATQAAIHVLRKGGNAVDAAVAAAGVLNVVEPYQCGIGGGGFMVIYRAARNRTVTIDSRETAPAAFQPTTFVDPATGLPIPFQEAVTSGLGVGVPGTVRGWELALDRYGTMDLHRVLKRAVKLAQQGFVVDPGFTALTEADKGRFRDFTSTRETYLTEEGEAPAPGSVFRNPDMANTLRRIGRDPDAFYEGAIARDIVNTVKHPPVVPGTAQNVRPGLMEANDLEDYEAKRRRPTRTRYRGLEVVGMGPPSSGGSTVGEALNILEGFKLGTLPRPSALHDYLEAAALAFADRGAYLGDPDFVSVPLTGLLSQGFADERRGLIEVTAAPKPLPAGDPYPFNDVGSASRVALSHAREGGSTTHLTVTDRWGNIVSYTFTIEQTGGSGIVVPGRGFLLNNELTDFEFLPGLPNSPDGEKRPRSSMSPTIVFKDGKPLLAVGSPGGAAIITTVLQILVNHLDLGMSLPDAIAAPRASQRNGPTTQSEPAFTDLYGAALTGLGHRLVPPLPFAGLPEIGAATGIGFLDGRRVQAAAEPVRRGGGSAMVERPID
jgi:gamma-glutamyltranspeptidase / glutathione hydrolase